MRSLAKEIALSGHLGDVQEAVDAALKRVGLPAIPTYEDGTMSGSGWLENAASLWSFPSLVDDPPFG